MTQKIINLGVIANDGSGDTFRQAMGKTNDNFTELYSIQDNFITEADSGQFIRADGGWLSLDSAGIVRDVPSDATLYARRDSSWIEIPSNLEAPLDGKFYGRVSQAWARVPEEANSDGTMYVRKDGDWSALPNIISDAEADGTPYVRQDSAWISLGIVTGIPEAPGGGQVFARADSAWLDITAELLNTGIDEAPINSFAYGRSASNWVTVTPEAPSNTNSYVRKGAAWSVLTYPVNEAPVDGEPYARLDSAWVRTVEEANSDGTVYGRVNGAWTEVLTDAPLDSAYYTRRNGAWEQPPVIDPVTNGLFLRDSSTWVALDSAAISTAIGQTFINGNGIVDADSDDTPYVRQNGGWVNAIEEAPQDSEYYSRINGGWAIATVAVTEAPLDSDVYARQNGGWVSVTTGGGSAPVVEEFLLQSTGNLSITAGTNTVFVETEGSFQQVELSLPDPSTYSDGDTMIVTRIDAIGTNSVYLWAADASSTINGIANTHQAGAAAWITLMPPDPFGAPGINDPNSVQFIKRGTAWYVVGAARWESP